MQNQALEELIENLNQGATCRTCGAAIESNGPDWKCYCNKKCSYEFQLVACRIGRKILNHQLKNGGCLKDLQL